MQTLEQRRALDAWEKSGDGVHKFGKKYINLAKRLPALIMNSGLMQVMVFLNQKQEGVHDAIGDDLRAWLHERFAKQVPSDFDGFMNAMLKDSRRNQAMTAEAIAWLKWLRHMASVQRRGA